MTIDRQAFLRLAEEIHRELAVSLPAMQLESDDSISLCLDLGDAPIEIIHSSSRNSSFLLLDCEVAPVSTDVADATGDRLLRAGGALFRTRQASLGVDAARQALFCSQWLPLASSTAADLLADALALARPLRAWARGGFHEEHLPGVLGVAAPAASIAGDDFVHWRRVFRALVESMGAGYVVAERHGSDDGSMVEVEIAHEGTLFSAVHSLRAPRKLTLELALAQAADLPAGEAAHLLALNSALSRGDCAAFSLGWPHDLARFACAWDLEAQGAEALQRRMTEIAAWAMQPAPGVD